MQCDNANSKNDKEKIIEALKTLKETRVKIGTETFREYLIEMGADDFFRLALNEMLGHFRSRKEKFEPRFKEMMTNIGNNASRKARFFDAILRFKPGKRGSKGGGVAAFGKELRQEWDDKTRILKRFRYLHLNRRTLEPKVKEELSDYLPIVPWGLRRKVRNTNVSDLVAEWMLWYYPCDETTLRRIIYNKKDNP